MPGALAPGAGPRGVGGGGGGGGRGKGRGGQVPIVCLLGACLSSTHVHTCSCSTARRSLNSCWLPGALGERGFPFL